MAVKISFSAALCSSAHLCGTTLKSNAEYRGEDAENRGKKT